MQMQTWVITFNPPAPRYHFDCDRQRHNREEAQGTAAGRGRARSGRESGPIVNCGAGEYCAITVGLCYRLVWPVSRYLASGARNSPSINPSWLVNTPASFPVTDMLRPQGFEPFMR